MCWRQLADKSVCPTLHSALAGDVTWASRGSWRLPLRRAGSGRRRHIGRGDGKRRAAFFGLWNFGGVFSRTAQAGGIGGTVFRFLLGFCILVFLVPVDDHFFLGAD